MTSQAVAFARRLRDVGLHVTTGQIALFLEALDAVDVDIAKPRTFHDVARATLVSASHELDAFEAAYAEFWTIARETSQASSASSAPTPPRLQPVSPPTVWTSISQTASDADAARTARERPSPADAIDRRLTWSAAEVLRHKRFDDLDPAESAEVQALMREAASQFELEPRRTRRYKRATHGTLLDWRRMAQRAVRNEGEWLERRWRVRRTTPRTLVILADISGSMECYARMLLTFAHVLTHRPTRIEAFAFATRLTRITRALQRRDANAALSEAATHIVDWAGGTRIGDSLHTFNRVWARRVLRQGAVVLIVSDAWDRGDPDRLAREVDRLHRSCHRLIWLNPLIGTTGFEPRTRGLIAALPFVDDFLPAHNLASLEDLMHRLATHPSRSVKSVHV